MSLKLGGLQYADVASQAEIRQGAVIRAGGGGGGGNWSGGDQRYFTVVTVKEQITLL